MTTLWRQSRVGVHLAGGLAILFACLVVAGAARSEVTAFKQAVAEAAARDDALAEFYRNNDYRPIWTSASAQDAERRKALFAAIDTAPIHGLPSERYDPGSLKEQLAQVRSPRDRGLAEVEMSRRLLRLARDMETGMLVPARIDNGIKRKVPVRKGAEYLADFAQSDPADFFRTLPPESHEYARLMKEKLRLERVAARGGWGGTVTARSLEPGDAGEQVVVLRDRLTAMGYLRRSMSQSYDARVQRAVQQFQTDHGLTPDGVAGAGTMAEINRGVDERLKSIHVAMERERWVNIDPRNRYILVNITDFTARIVDNGSVTFETRSVIGSTRSDKQTPEFSQDMTYLEINPDWTVPRGILRRDYLPKLQNNPNALGHLQVVDSRGRVVPRGQVNFARYSAGNFPFNLRQPPSRNNALGTVKFMFPNPYAIYLHDTPEKHLFSRETRAYSSGCVRLNDPYDFAYELLSRQEADPEPFFQRILNSGRQTRVNLETPVPVHLIYRTAFTRAKGNTQYRRDIYGRDAAIWDALSRAGVTLQPVQG
ncbi:murein L,D-transpeptidase [Aquicoccus sp.]|uniref:L,D-transpeptidase family protein n=1 Tax=Aquicoccus sp. TaxID=2055851 RepID=UPI003567AEF7